MKTNLSLLITFLCFQKSYQSICEYFQQASEDAVSSECMTQLKILCDNGALMWKMFDASSKYPISGLSYSNNRDLGNFDECININYESFNGTINGKYCALSLGVVNFFLDGGIPDPFKLNIQPKTLAGAQTINASALRASQPSVTTLSLCIPHQCNAREVGKFFIWANFEPLVFFTEDIGVNIPCITKDSYTDFEWYDIFFIAFLAFILFLIISSTSYDYLLQKTGRKPKSNIFLAFSFITNGRKLLHITANNQNTIPCLNGLRFISMMWVICGHNVVAIESLPLVNYAELAKFADNVKLQYIAAAPIAVDTFFFLSGFLLTYSYLKSAANLTVVKQIFGIPMMVLHRYLRLTPALAVLYFASVTIFRMLGAGPLWGEVAEGLSDQCTRHWWPFFLYVQNYVNYDDMCLNHSWYLSADMQMFILAPIVLIPITVLLRNNKRNEAIISLLVLITICVIFPMAIRFADQTITNVYDTHSRLNDYLIGVLLGVIMRDCRFEKFPFSKLTNLAIWCFVLNCCVAFILYYHNIIRIYDHTSDTLFYGLYRPVWCFSLAWMVYSCYHGYGGFVNWILSLPAFQIGARLSYCMYLLHAVVEMYFVGLVRTPYYWGDYSIFYVWCGHFIVTMVLSFIWSLAFESPMITIERFIFGGQSKPKKRQQQLA